MTSSMLMFSSLAGEADIPISAARASIFWCSPNMPCRMLWVTSSMLMFSSQQRPETRATTPTVAVAVDECFHNSTPFLTPPLKGEAFAHGQPSPQRGSHWRVGQAHAERAKRAVRKQNCPSADWRQLDKIRLFRSCCPASGARPCVLSGFQRSAQSGLVCQWLPLGELSRRRDRGVTPSIADFTKNEHSFWKKEKGRRAKECLSPAELAKTRCKLPGSVLYLSINIATG